MTLRWELPLDMDQGPQQQSTHHGLPLLATTEPLPPLYLQVSAGDVFELNHIIGSTWEKRATAFTKSQAAQWLPCPWLLPWFYEKTQ